MDTKSRPLNVAIVGLGFGAEFIPIYQRHPDANMAAICQRNEAKLCKVGDAFGIEKRYTNYDDVLADPSNRFRPHQQSPIPDHAWMSIAALKAGKHVMCTVPMATTIEECEQICELVAETGLKYMMAETVVYSREFLFIKEMYKKGELGKIQHLAASHPQDMDGWPDYWEKMIPMHYATHVVSPVLGLVNGRAEYVSLLRLGHGPRRHREEVGQQVRRRVVPHQDQGHRRRRPHLAVPVRHGPAVSRELRRLRHEEELRVDAGRGRAAHPAHGEEAGAGDCRARSKCPTSPTCCRSRSGSSRGRSHDAEHLSFIQGGGHGGSHPHLVNEFVERLVEDRDPWPNARDERQLDLRRHSAPTSRP